MTAGGRAAEKAGLGAGCASVALSASSDILVWCGSQKDPRCPRFFGGFSPGGAALTAVTAKGGVVGQVGGRGPIEEWVGGVGRRSGVDSGGRIDK